MGTKKLYSALILALVSTTSYSQADSMLNDFTAFVSGSNVVLDWEIGSGNLCNGIKIHRSSDDINWQEIGEIVGQCGSISEPVHYQWTDYSPIPNSINYYKLELGVSGSTSSINIHYVELGSDEYKIAPHPITSVSKIYFSNPSKLEYCFKVIDLAGNIVYMEEDIHTDEVEFDRTGLDPGYYFFTLLYDGDAKYSGKLVVN